MHVAPSLLTFALLRVLTFTLGVHAFEDYQWHPLCTSPDECVFPTQPLARSRHAAASIHDSMFIFGGEGDPATQDTSLRNDLWHYSGTTYQWTHLCAFCEDMPAPRRHATLSVVETKSGDTHVYTLYLYGGGTGDRNQRYIDPETMIFQDFWSLTLDVSSDGSLLSVGSNWVQLCSQETGCDNVSPGRRYLSSTATIDNLIYLYGGGYPSKNDVWVFNPSGRTWQELCPSTRPGNVTQTSPCCGNTFDTRCPEPYGTYGSMSVIDSNSFMVYEHLAGSPFIFDIAEGKWKGLCTGAFCYRRGTPEGLHAPSMAVIDNMLLLEGGVTSDGVAQSNVWLFDLDHIPSVQTGMFARWSLDSQSEVDSLSTKGAASYAFSSTVPLETENGEVFASFGGEVDDTASDELWMLANVAPVLPEFSYAPATTTPPVVLGTPSPPITSEVATSQPWYENLFILAGASVGVLVCCCTMVCICARASYKHHHEHEHTAHQLKSLDDVDAGPPPLGPPPLVQMASQPHIREPHLQQVTEKEISSTQCDTESYCTQPKYYDDIGDEEFPFEEFDAYDIAPRKDVIVCVDTPEPSSPLSGQMSPHAPLSRWNSQQTLLPVSYTDKPEPPDSVEDFLSRLSLARYKDSFIEEGFDSIMALSMITPDDLTEFGVRRGHQRLIMKAIQEVQHESLLNNTHSKDVTMGTITPTSVDMATIRGIEHAITVKQPPTPTSLFHTKPPLKIDTVVAGGRRDYTSPHATDEKRDQLCELPMSVDDGRRHDDNKASPSEHNKARRTSISHADRQRNRRPSNNPLSAGPVIHVSSVPVGLADGDERRPSQVANPMPRRPSQVMDFIKRAADNSNNHSPSGSFGGSSSSSKNLSPAAGGRFGVASPSDCFGLVSPSLEFHRTPSPAAWPSPSISEVRALKSRSERFMVGDLTVKPSGGIGVGTERKNYDSAFSTKRARINAGETLRVVEKDFREEVPSAFSFSNQDIKRASKGSNSSSSSRGTPGSNPFNKHRKRISRSDERYPKMRECTGINISPVRRKEVHNEKRDNGPPEFEPVPSPKAKIRNISSAVPPPFRKNSGAIPPPMPFSKGPKVPPTPPAFATHHSRNIRSAGAAPTPPPPPPNVIVESRSFRGLSDAMQTQNHTQHVQAPPPLPQSPKSPRKSRSRKSSRAGQEGKKSRKSSRADISGEDGRKSRKSSRAGHESTGGRRSRKSSRAGHGHDSVSRKSRSRKSSRAGVFDGRRSRKASHAGEDDDILRANTISKPPTLPRRSKSLHRQRRRPSIMSGGK